MAQRGRNKQGVLKHAERPFKISSELEKNKNELKRIFGNNADIIFREFNVGQDDTRALVICIEGLSDKALVNEYLIQPLLAEAKDLQEKVTFERLIDGYISINDIKETTEFAEVLKSILSGDTVLLLDGMMTALILGTKDWEHRSLGPPETEASIRGSREGFSETLRVNTALVRRRIKDVNLYFETMQIGKISKTDICLVYLRNLASQDIIDEVRRRLQAIDIDAILESNYIEELICDAPYSPVPTIGVAESSDKFVAKILEGRVGILVDGTPFALTAPMLFIENFQVAEDYYTKSPYASIFRILRYFAFHVTVFLPGIYVALLTFHPSLLPLPLLVTIVGIREGIPFPTVLETFILLLFFETLREAGVRMPRAVGQAVSIVGALILGDAAVSAGLSSYLAVIVIALSAIASFILPHQLNVLVSVLRFVVLLASSIMGLLGLVWCYLMLIIYLVSLRSFGVPYMSPFMPFRLKDMKDALIRVPMGLMKTRPHNMGVKDEIRQKNKMQKQR